MPKHRKPDGRSEPFIARPIAEIIPWKGIFSPGLWRAFGYLTGQGWLLGLIGLISLLYIPFALVEPFLVKFLVDRIMLQHEPELLVRLAGAMILFFAAYGVVEFVSMYLVLKLGQRLHRTIKSEQLANLLAKGLNFHRGTASGKLIYAFFNDASQIGVLLSLGMTNTVMNLLFILVRSGILFWIAPRLLPIYLVVLPLQSIVMYRLTKRVLAYTIEMKTMDEDLTSRVESMLAGAVAVKGFGFADVLRSAWERIFDVRLDLDLRNMMWQRGGYLVIGQLQIIGSFLILFYGVYLVQGGYMTLGNLLAFLAVSGRLTPSVQGLIAFAVGMQETLVGMERYFKIYDLPDEEGEYTRERPRDIEARELASEDIDEIRVQNPFVQYTAARLQIPCEFTLDRGQSYLWHGPNGSGKSSVGMALAGLIPHSRGSILVGGRPLADFGLASIRSRVLYVGNQPFWPQRTLADTFTDSEGDVKLDEERARECLRVAEAEDVIDSLPRGFAHVFTDNGRSLSHGENQRLFLAVALYRRPEVLILDEVLSNVPSLQRRRIIQKLATLAPRPILVLITNTDEHSEHFDHSIAFRARVRGSTVRTAALAPGG